MITQLVTPDERIQIGVGTYATNDPLIKLFHPNNKVVIGKFCSIADSVTIFSGGNHPVDMISTHPLKLFFGVDDFSGWTNDCGDGNEITKIGNDVWLGHGCTVLSGSNIGDGAIIGAKAVVRGKIPPYAIVVGNPAVIIRYRFDQQTIKSLLTIKWWDWPSEKIRDEASNLTSRDVINFLNRHSCAK
jgi:acetyltransferase-like isoleucine patch superfamily enzyme